MKPERRHSKSGKALDRRAPRHLRPHEALSLVSEDALESEVVITSSRNDERRESDLLLESLNRQAQAEDEQVQADTEDQLALYALYGAGTDEVFTQDSFGADRTKDRFINRYRRTRAGERRDQRFVIAAGKPQRIKDSAIIEATKFVSSREARLPLADRRRIEMGQPEVSDAGLILEDHRRALEKADKIVTKRRKALLSGGVMTVHIAPPSGN
jgi:hypothetical protein